MHERLQLMPSQEYPGIACVFNVDELYGVISVNKKIKTIFIFKFYTRISQMKSNAFLIKFLN